MPVHPRVCGERLTLSRRIAPARGSSPRVRGTPGGAAVCRRHGRFIPACAGNAAHGGLVAVPEAVHPRVCGERVHPEAPSCIGYGSSPRVRGTHFIDLLELPEQKRGHRIYRDAATPTRTWSFKEAFG